VEFEWDPAKAKTNIRKHRVNFDQATRVFLDPNRIERPDEGDPEGEERWQVLGRVEEFVLVVVYTVRWNLIRIISARRAELDEYFEYWNG
jgi:uncharacterized DUF497 family protein